MADYLELKVAKSESNTLKRISRYLFYPTLNEAFCETVVPTHFGVSRWKVLPYQSAVDLATKAVRLAQQHPSLYHVTGSFIDQTYREEDTLSRLFKGEKLIIGGMVVKPK